MHAFLFVVPTKDGHFPGIVGHPFQEVARHLNGVVVLPGSETMPAEAVGEIVIYRVEIDGTLAFRGGFSHAAHSHKIVSMLVANVCIVRIQLQSPFEFVFRSSKIPIVMQFRRCQGRVTFWQLIILLDR